MNDTLPKETKTKRVEPANNQLPDTKDQQKHSAPEKKGFLQRFKEKWNITSNLSLILILVAFSINGSFAVWVAKPVLAFFNVSKDTLGPVWYYPVRIALILPIYQLTLPLAGALVGQFKFFWAFQKKTVGRMFGRRSKSKEKE